MKIKHCRYRETLTLQNPAHSKARKDTNIIRYVVDSLPSLRKKIVVGSETESELPLKRQLILFLLQLFILSRRNKKLREIL